VYTELILKRKVDWTTFPTTTQYPLRIGQNQKHIPDLFDPESALTKNILEELKKRPRRMMAVDTMPEVQHSVQEVVIVPESEKHLDIVVDNILSTTIAQDSLDERTTKDPVQSEIQNIEMGGGEDDGNVERVPENTDREKTVVSKVQALEGLSPETKDAGPSTSTRKTLEPNFNDPMITMGTISGIEEMLRTMPNNDKLKELLNFSVKWAELCLCTNDGGVAKANKVELTPKDSEAMQEIMGVLRVARNLKNGAEILATMAPSLLEMAHAFATLTPSVLEAALNFETLTSCIGPMLEERVSLLTDVIALKAVAEKSNAFTKQVVKELEAYKKMEAGRVSNKLGGIKGTRMESTNLVVREADVVVMESNAETSDDPFLSKFEGNDRVDATPIKAKGPAEPSSVEQTIEVGCSQVRIEAQRKEKAIVECGQEMESVLQKLELANKERDEARAELETLRRTLRSVDDTPCNENTMPWLGWVHRLQDRETMVSKAQHDLKKYAAESQVSCQLVETSLERFKNVIGQRGHEPTKVTIWGDVAEMMDRTNYHRKGKGNGINWALEVEEGWVPYNIFSAHFAESERRVIHTCNPVPAFLNDKCSLCQEHFGPEGVYTLGQCGHNFHTTCISESSMRQSVCPMCRSPISRRFYEVMGIRDVMPPGHEFNRWNLPLDQLPKKFLNYRQWGKPLIWNSEFSCHQLYEEYEMECDPLFWMTQDYEVEIRARDIEDDKQ